MGRVHIALIAIWIVIMGFISPAHSDELNLPLSPPPGPVQVSDNAALYPVISVPMDPSKPVEFYSMTLEDNGPRDLKKKVFRKVKVEKGEVLDINSIVISRNLLATMDDQTRGTDAPQMGDVEYTIDTKDPAKFLKLLLKMAQERRHAESDEEWNRIVERFNGNEERAHFNDYLYSTPYLEVSGKHLKNLDPGIRYYVPLAQVMAGAGRIDVQKAKLKVISGLSLYMFKYISDGDKPAGKEALFNQVQKMGESIGEICSSRSCNLTGEAPVGLLLADLHMIYRAGADLDLSDSNTAMLQLRKQICVIKRLHDLCPNVSGFSGIDDIVRIEKLDCHRRESILLGLTEDKE